MAAISDLNELVASMEPRLNEGVYVFATVGSIADVDGASVVALMQEPEGLSVVMTESDALRQGIPHEFRSSWITLTVTSALEAVGLTAAFAQALGDVQISCNVIAGHHHDHIFVPTGSTDAAMAALRGLQRAAG
ncbi:ACT domain-containing protein [Salinibacterium sp. NK8237]|uniref:ACT domain-containing protein n=1 Tax=Salinibacterium sp. NK8237 TaxID=2792038 RepID=UPI0018CEE248|nr:ACT domain-containing protein [Salinibacterium sp. NK8237]MBH0129284.1 ACT domain-containing protein [Salinibacterium sp. NK8237]